MHKTKENLASLFETILQQHGFKGEFYVDQLNRIINATDNSIYEVTPVAVAQPFDVADLRLLIKLANQEPFTCLDFCARGGGTGTNGQALTTGVVIDFSRYMHRVLEFKPEQRTITVEPGIILSDLNRQIAKHGLFFAANVSTADRATIGGMIATDAAGKGSLIYGKTADHVLGMQLILANGAVINTLDPHTVAPNNTVQTQLEQKIAELLLPVQAEIKQRFPTLKRPLSGYNIQQCFIDGQVQLERLIAGSEGTLGLLAAAKLKLLPLPKFKALVVVHYLSFQEALQAAQFLIQFKPLAIEAVDEKVQKSAQSLPNWPTLARWLNSVDKNYISNFIEFVADSQTELDTKLAQVTAVLAAQQANYVLILDHSQINQLWTIRSLAVGLVGKLPGSRKPVAFVEDAIVPPENLANLVADLQAELDQRQLDYAMYGHVDVGCIHVRPALNMQDLRDRAQIRPLTEMLMKLVKKYHGLLWGEHGKGYRGEFVPEVFGPILYPILCQIKSLFDPLNRLNPGKLAAPKPITQLHRIDLVPMRGEFDQIILPSLQTTFSDALLCNGNAACFNADPNNVMCPSYKVTRDRIHSPKGRAMLIKHWLREKSKPNGQHSAAALAAFEALNGCLGCKGCAGKCPTQVSIPDLRSNFLYHYHKLYQRRNLRDLILGNIEKLLPLAAKFPKVWNFMQRQVWLPRLGIRNIPRFKTDLSLAAGLAKLRVASYTQAAEAATLPRTAVVIFADVFTGYLDNNVLFATIEICYKLSLVPYVIYPRVSGKALIVGGFVDQFKVNSLSLAELFEPLFQRGIPILGLENTITSLFRDEIAKFTRPFNGKVLSLAEFLIDYRYKLKQLVPDSLAYPVTKYRLLPHCTEQALLPTESQHWQQIFLELGVKLEIRNLGCCGMAGTYGHLVEQQRNSQDLFSQNWQASIADTQINILASGFSCRAQTANLAQLRLRHPIEALLQLVSQSALRT